MMEHNFCQRCGKRVTDIGVHTCSPQSALTAVEQLRADLASKEQQLAAQAEQIKVARMNFQEIMREEPDRRVIAICDEALAKLGE